MALIGSDNQVTSSTSSSILFNPTITVGDGNVQEQQQTTDLTSTTSPKQDNSATASVGVGVGGGSGSGGAVKRQEGEGQSTPQPFRAKRAVSGSPFSSIDSKTLLMIGGALLAGAFGYSLFKKKAK